MDNVKLAEQTAELAKENEALQFRVFLQEQYNLQVMQWRNQVTDCLGGLTKQQAFNLTMADFQPMPIPKFVAAHLESKEMLSIYKSMEHIFPTAKKYEDELNFIIENYKHYANTKKK
jgi:hypothetical protein